MKNRLKLASTLSLALLIILLPACNTTKGFGKDVEKVGTSMKNSAEKNGAD